MRSQMVVIINGRGGVGKDTLIESLNPFYAVRNISSITPIKDLAGRVGWNGKKDEKSRKLLSDLKSLLTAYNDYPLTYLMYEYNKFTTSHDDIMFVQIREPEEIDKFKKQVTIPCVTLLVVRDGANSPLGNTSDDNCDQYLYDYIFRNNYSIEQMQDQFARFIKQLFIDAYRNPYVKTDGPEEISVVYHSPDIDKLDYIDGKSDWIDLRSAEEVVLIAGEFAVISLGISMKLPDGYEAHVVPRSSTFKNYGIIQTNSMGIIDQSYCGQNDIWKLPVYATRDTVIHVNDRICQFRIVKNQPKLVFNEVSELTGENRGGFGSTGIS